jgi:hypothetical protein
MSWCRRCRACAFIDDQAVEKSRQRRSRIAQGLNVRDKVRLALSLAAALLDDLFEQLVGIVDAHGESNANICVETGRLARVSV